MWRDKCLDDLSSAVDLFLLKREVSAFQGGRRSTTGWGNVMASGRGDVTMTQGKHRFVMVESVVIFQLKKPKWFRSWWMCLKSRNTGASGQAADILHAWSILQGGKNTLFFIHSILIHILTSPGCDYHSQFLTTSSMSSHICVYWACMCVYMHTLWGEGGEVVYDLAVAAEFVWHVEGED